MTDQPVREEVWFSGRVQGVGFRITVKDAARGFAVTGFVENLEDGRVRLLAEGKPSEIDRFVAAIESEMERFIAGVDRYRQAATGEFDGFWIQR
jgi:acylphosphatase